MDERKESLEEDLFGALSDELLDADMDVQGEIWTDELFAQKLNAWTDELTQEQEKEPSGEMAADMPQEKAEDVVEETAEKEEKLPTLEREEGADAKKRKKWIIILSALVAVLVAAILGVAVMADPMHLWAPEETTEATVPTQTEAETEPTTEPTTVPTTLPYTPSGQDIINVLVVGQAARAGEDTRLSDTMVLVTVNKNTKVVTLTSFLRDAYVDMPDYMGHTCGWNRINVVYNLGWQWGDVGGAMEMMDICIKNNFGVEVDYNVEVDFVAFSKIIDVLGGVRIELNESEVNYLNKDSKTWQEVTVGENRLFGDAALAYARMRKATGDGDSDIKRTARQRTLITAVINKLATKLTYEGFDTLLELAEEVLPLITTDMTNEEITTCIWEILPLLPDMTIETGTCPVEGTYWGEIIDLFGYPSSVLKFNAEKNKVLMGAITEGTSVE